MNWQRILLVVDAPEGVSRLLAGKLAVLARGLGAEVCVFDAVFDPIERAVAFSRASAAAAS